MGIPEELLKVQALSHMDNCTIFWHEESGGDVYRIWDTFFLFEIPHYGGEGTFAGAFDASELNSLLLLASTWT